MAGADNAEDGEMLQNWLLDKAVAVIVIRKLNRPVNDDDDPSADGEVPLRRDSILTECFFSQRRGSVRTERGDRAMYFRGAPPEVLLRIGEPCHDPHRQGRPPVPPHFEGPRIDCR